MKAWTLTLALLLSIAAIPAADAGFTFNQPESQQAPVCNPYCVTSQCSSHSDCTAAPNGRCDFACPGVGCCVYN